MIGLYPHIQCTENGPWHDKDRQIEDYRECVDGDSGCPSVECRVQEHVYPQEHTEDQCQHHGLHHIPPRKSFPLDGVVHDQIAGVQIAGDVEQEHDHTVPRCEFTLDVDTFNNRQHTIEQNPLYQFHSYGHTLRTHEHI